MGGTIKSLAKAKIINIHCSAVVQQPWQFLHNVPNLECPGGNNLLMGQNQHPDVP